MFLPWSAVVFFQLLCAPTGAAEPRPASIYWKDDLALLVKIQQTKLPRIEAVFAQLEIKPGMTILDIGAGTGQQSYRLAEKLRGTGRVYAADISPMLVDYVAAQARKRGLTNLEAVLVKKKGVDDFYARRKYDLILLYDVCYHLHDRVGFFKGIRNSLKPGGRVVVVDPESRERAFAPEDLADAPGLMAELRNESLGTPYGRWLRRPLQAIFDEDGGAGGPYLKRAVLLQLNRVMSSVFFAEFIEGPGFAKGVDFTADERPYALWSLHRMKLAGLPLERPLGEIDKSEFEELRMFNKMLLIQRFRRFFVRGNGSPYFSADPISRRLDPDVIRQSFEAAGYRLVGKRDLIPFEAVWTFAAD